MNKLPLLQLDDIRKTYNGQTFALDGISLSVDAGEIVCLLGPSGCGKTTLLRIIAGLEKKDRGRILFKGRNLDDTPVHERNFGLMFQDFALFPHKSVAENVAFGLRMARWPAARAATRVNEMLALVDLPGHTQRSIFELSGGERQRVALARSLAPSPELLMLDEPLGSLDRKLREELMAELRKILKTVGQTAVYVTHDQEEAFEVADPHCHPRPRVCPANRSASNYLQIAGQSLCSPLPRFQQFTVSANRTGSTAVCQYVYW